MITIVNIPEHARLVLGNSLSIWRNGKIIGSADIVELSDDGTAKAEIDFYENFEIPDIINLSIDETRSTITKNKKVKYYLAIHN